MEIYKNLLFLKKYLYRTRYHLVIAILIMISASVISSPLPYLMGKIIDISVDSLEFNAGIVRILLVLTIIYVSKTALTFMYHFLFTKIQYSVVNGLRLEILKNIVNAPMEILSSKDKGYVMGRINEVQQIGSLFNVTNLNCMMGFLEVFFYLFVMFSMSIKLTIVCLIFIPIYYLIALKHSKKIVENTINLQESSAVLNGEVFETLNGIEEIKFLGGVEKQVSKITRKLTKLTYTAIKQSVSFIKFVQAIVLTNEMINLIIIAISCYLIVKNEVSVGVYTSFAVYVSKILNITQNIGGLEITVKPICATICRLKEFVNIENENDEALEIFDEDINIIEFKDVCFGYNKENLIFENFNMKIKRKDRIRIIGNNGSGKTTIIKLMTGLYQPLQGIISINGIDLKNINKTSIRNRIGVVSQNPFLFKGTVLENILYASPNMTKKDVYKLVLHLNLSPYLDSFEKGLETNIMQSGASISGGQAQFIAILRALIGKKEILVLDEATSNLDVNMQEKLLKILEQKGMFDIMIIISHQEISNNAVNKMIYI